MLQKVIKLNTKVVELNYKLTLTKLHYIFLFLQLMWPYTLCVLDELF